MGCGSRRPHLPRAPTGPDLTTIIYADLANEIRRHPVQQIAVVGLVSKPQDCSPRGPALASSHPTQRLFAAICSACNGVRRFSRGRAPQGMILMRRPFRRFALADMVRLGRNRPPPRRRPAELKAFKSSRGRARLSTHQALRPGISAVSTSAISTASAASNASCSGIRSYTLAVKFLPLPRLFPLDNYVALLTAISLAESNR